MRPDHNDRRPPRPGGPRREFRDNRSAPPRTGPPRHGGRPDQREPKAPRIEKPEIVHRGAGVLVVNKPAGMPVRGDGTDTLRESVHALAFARRERLKPWHAIDTGASGAVAFVTGKERDDLAPPEARPEVTYLALVEHEFNDETSQTGTSINAPVEGSRTANPVTHIRVIAQGNGLALIQARCRPDLMHQVRTHLAHIDHPIVGDFDLGTGRDDVGRLALHALEVRFRDLEDGTIQRIKVPAPHTWWSLIGATPAAGMSDAPDPSAHPADQHDKHKDNEDKGWDNVAHWYDDLLTTRGSDHHERVVLPGVERLVALQPHEKLLDIACGQGAVTRHLIQATPGATALGVDASEQLIERAHGASPESIEYKAADARELGTLNLEGFDAATCVLALMNIDPITPVFQGAHDALKPGGRLVAVILHPAFRNPGATAWGWTRDERNRREVQFRRVDQYTSPRSHAIVMNPGAVSRGEPAVTTTTHHRPIGAYVQAAADAGFTIDALEEWTSDRTSEPGPRAAAENLARREIPMFLAMRLRRN